MKLEYSQKWFEMSAEIEVDSDVGAGCPAASCSRRRSNTPMTDAAVSRWANGDGTQSTLIALCKKLERKVSKLKAAAAKSSENDQVEARQK